MIIIAALDANAKVEAHYENGVLEVKLAKKEVGPFVFTGQVR